MDDRRLSEIEARIKAASDDWRITDTTPPDGRTPEWILIEGPRGFCDEQGCAMTNIALSDMSDAQLIAHAPDDLRDLLAEVRRLSPIVAAAMDLSDIEIALSETPKQPIAVNQKHRDLCVAQAMAVGELIGACRKAREGR